MVCWCQYGPSYLQTRCGRLLSPLSIPVTCYCKCDPSDGVSVGYLCRRYQWLGFPEEHSWHLNCNACVVPEGCTLFSRGLNENINDKLVLICFVTTTKHRGFVMFTS